MCSSLVMDPMVLRYTTVCRELSDSILNKHIYIHIRNGMVKRLNARIKYVIAQHNRFQVLRSK